MRIHQFFLRILFNCWGFQRSSGMLEDEAMYSAFEQLWSSRGNRFILDYDLPYDKAHFTQWLTQEKSLLLHGSNQAGIELLEPRTQTNYRGQPVEGVFASSDGIWPMYFALLDFQNPNLQTTRNGCFSLGEERYYLFCVNRAALELPIWNEGWLYILPSGGFVSQDPGGMWQSEWICKNQVKPLACLPISYQDFPFWQGVAGFPKGEYFLFTWARYGRRVEGSS